MILMDKIRNMVPLTNIHSEPRARLEKKDLVPLFSLGCRTCYEEVSTDNECMKCLNKSLATTFER